MFYLCLAVAAYVGYRVGLQRAQTSAPKLDPRLEVLAGELRRQDELARAATLQKTKESLIATLAGTPPPGN